MGKCKPSGARSPDFFSKRSQKYEFSVKFLEVYTYIYNFLLNSAAQTIDIKRKEEKQRKDKSSRKLPVVSNSSGDREICNE
jgi:hypothetical protein